GSAAGPGRRHLPPRSRPGPQPGAGRPDAVVDRRRSPAPRRRRDHRAPRGAAPLRRRRAGPAGGPPPPALAPGLAALPPDDVVDRPAERGELLRVADAGVLPGVFAAHRMAHSRLAGIAVAVAEV